MTAVDRWQRALVARAGLTEAEATGLLVALRAFCERHHADPEAVLVHWEGYPELTVRRTRPGPPDLAVESFLVHDGPAAAEAARVDAVTVDAVRRAQVRASSVPRWASHSSAAAAVQAWAWLPSGSPVSGS